MNKLYKYLWITLACFSLVGLQACDNDSDLENAAEDAADGVEDAGEDVGDAIEDATN